MMMLMNGDEEDDKTAIQLLTWEQQQPVAATAWTSHYMGLTIGVIWFINNSGNNGG